MIKIKISTNFPEWPLLRQTQDGNGKWNHLQFYVNEDIDECDVWIVYEGLSREEITRCSKDNIIFITGEPPSIKAYPYRFLKQFSKVVSSHKNLPHPSVIRTQQAQPWFIGASYGRTYSDLAKPLDHEKTKLISTVSSTKRMVEGHIKRLNFVEQLLSAYGPQIDVFGRGLREIEDKWDAIVPYKYHIVIENEARDDYWTEKLADCFLGEAYPFYFGCTNIEKYFPAGSMTVIDINNIDLSLRMIEETIRVKQYEKSLPYIKKAKQLILDQYNLFALIESLVQHLDLEGKKERVTVKGEFYFA